MAVTDFAPAKVNLTLHVTGQRADGYHLLDSLVVFADVGDRVTVAASDSLSLQMTGPMASRNSSLSSGAIGGGAGFLLMPAMIAKRLRGDQPPASGQRKK